MSESPPKDRFIYFNRLIFLGLNQNIQKTVQSTAINDSNSNYPSSNSSISSSRSSMSSLSSDAVNNKSSNEGYFNSSYFKLQGNSNVKCKPSQKISSSQLTHSLKRKYSDELTESRLQLFVKILKFFI